MSKDIKVSLSINNVTETEETYAINKLKQSHYRIIKFLGFDTSYGELKDDNDLILEYMENGITIKDTQNNKSKNNTLIYIYNIFILSLISWTTIASIVLSIINNDMSFILRILYNIIFITYYVFGLTYFKKDHIYSILNKHELLNKRYNILLIIGVFISCLIVGAIVTVVLRGNKVHVYSIFYETSNIYIRIFLLIVLMLDTFYSYSIFFTISITFCLVMIHHKSVMTIYNGKLKKYIMTPTGINAKVNTMGVEYVRLKQDFSKTVECLNYFFVTLNIFGILGFNMTIVSFQNHNYLFVDILDSFLFLLIEIIYIISIQYVRNNINDIIGILTTPQFVSAMLRSYNNERNIKINFEDNSLDAIGANSRNSLISSLTIDESIDWLIFDAISTKPWETFNILGIEINDTTVLQKLFGFIVLIALSNNISNILQ